MNKDPIIEDMLVLAETVKAKNIKKAQRLQEAEIRLSHRRTITRLKNILGEEFKDYEKVRHGRQAYISWKGFHITDLTGNYYYGAGAILCGEKHPNALVVCDLSLKNNGYCNHGVARAFDKESFAVAISQILEYRKIFKNYLTRMSNMHHSPGAPNYKPKKKSWFKKLFS